MEKSAIKSDGNQSINNNLKIIQMIIQTCGPSRSVHTFAKILKHHYFNTPNRNHNINPATIFSEICVYQQPNVQTCRFACILHFIGAERISEGIYLQIQK